MQTLFIALFNGNSVLMWSFIVLSTFGTAIVLLLLKHRDEAAVNRDWETLLSGKGEKLYLSIELRMQTELDLADMAYGEALAVRELGSMDEGIRLLELGQQNLVHTAPTMWRSLSAQ